MLIAFLRTLLLYLLIFTGIRLMGKKQVGELEPAELVLAMLISDLAAVPMQDFGIPLLFGVIPILTLLCVSMILSVLVMKSPPLRLLLCGKPTIIVENGRLLQRELRRTRLTSDELMEELRLLGITDLTQVKYAILETSGRISVIRCSNQQPVTACQLSLQTQETGLPLTLIDNGQIYPENLRRRGVDQNWLKKELEKRGYHSHKDVFFMTMDESGGIYFVPKEDS